MLKNPNWNNISDFWAIGETVEETAQALGITEAEVREVFDYHEAALMDYFVSPDGNELVSPEDEEYFVMMNK